MTLSLKDKYQIKLSQKLPFASCPATAELDPEDIIVSDVIFDGEYNPNNVKPFVIGHVFGAVALVFASCKQYAFDEAMDHGLLGCFEVGREAFEKMTEDEREELAYLGNASEPCNLNDAWIGEVNLKEQDLAFLLALAEGRGAVVTKLSELR